MSTISEIAGDRSILISQSNQNYQPGDIILRCTEPVVHVTKYEHRMFVCDQCLAKLVSGVACPACRKVYYCGQQCQQMAWDRVHRLECPILARHPPLQFENKGIDYMQRLTLRLYLLMSEPESGPALQTRPFPLPNGLEQTFATMECHQEQLKDSPQFEGILNYFRLYRIEPFDRDLLLRCYGILQVNSFGIDCYREGPIVYSGDSARSQDPANKDTEYLSIDQCGTGLYVEASIFDHSCVPNACASGDGLELEIRALRPIGPGERIYIDYLQDVMPRQERQQSLQERYFFRCQCDLGCADSLDPKAAFDSDVDYRRYSVLEKLIEQLTPSDDPVDPESPEPIPKRTTTNNRQLYSLMCQRLTILERFYSKSVYHPCLSLYYHSLLRFLLLNHTELNNIEQQMMDLGPKARDQLVVTHGSAHRFYQTLERVVLKHLPKQKAH